MLNNGVSVEYADEWVVYGIRQLRQLTVSTFFLFTGYGIMTSLTQKGKKYAGDLIAKRFFSLQLHLTLVMLIYVLVQFSVGNTYSMPHILSSFAAWSSVGTPTWFIFVTLLSYLFIAISWHLWHRFHPIALVLSVTTMLAIMIPLIISRGTWWANSCLCLSAGMLYKMYQSEIEKFIKTIRIPVWCIGILLIPVGFYVYRYLPNLEYKANTYDEVVSVLGKSLLTRVYIQNAGCIIFALGILFFFAGIRFARKPSFLVWSGGAALFYLYLFHQLPMILGKHWGLNYSNPIFYKIMCIAITLLLARLSCRIFPFIDSHIWVNENSVKNSAEKNNTDRTNSPPISISLKLGVVIGSAVICLIGLYYLWIPRGICVSFKYAVDNPVAFQIFYTGNTRNKWIGSEKQTVSGEGLISFFLPTKVIHRFRLDMGKNPGQIVIDDLWVTGKTAVQLSTLSSFSINNIETISEGSEGLQIVSNKNNPHMVYNRPINMRAGNERQFQTGIFIMILIIGGSLGFMLLNLYQYLKNSTASKESRE